MGFKFNSNLSQPYYGGGGTTTLVPTVLDAALGGHPYRIDWLSERPIWYEGIDTLRDQADQSDSPGEQSITRSAYWRRNVESWDVGAGQVHYDRPESNRRRFRRSKGINNWEDFELTLHHTVIQELSTSSTNLKLIVVGGHLYLTDGTDIKFWTNVTSGTFTSLTGEPATAATSIVSDGFNVFTSHAANGIYKTTRGAATTASHITGTVNLLGYARGRFLATSGTTLYDATTILYGAGGVAITTATSLLVHPNTDWTWTAFGEGSSQIYAAGFSGDKSLIYHIHIKDDGTGLDAPIVAAELPDGEIVRSLRGYLGRFLFIGLDQGFRVAVVQDSGDLTVGALIELPMPVLDFEPQEEFVWFGWGNHGNELTSAAATGLGRLSTSQFSDLSNLVPAYSSDLMVDGQSANITSVVTFQGLRMFTVDQIGLYYEDPTNLVPTGYIDSGLINFNLTEEKIGLFIDVQHSTLMQDLYELYVSIDEGTFINLGPPSGEGTRTYNLGQTSARNFEIRQVLHRDATDTSFSVTLYSWLLRVQPRPILTSMIYATILLAEQVESLVDGHEYFDTFAELEYINSLYLSKEITTFQWGKRSDAIVLDGYRLMVHEVVEQGVDGGNGYNASCILELKKAF